MNEIYLSIMFVIGNNNAALPESVTRVEVDQVVYSDGTPSKDTFRRAVWDRSYPPTAAGMHACLADVAQLRQWVRLVHRDPEADFVTEDTTLCELRRKAKLSPKQQRAIDRATQDAVNAAQRAATEGANAAFKER